MWVYTETKKNAVFRDLLLLELISLDIKKGRLRCVGTDDADWVNDYVMNDNGGRWNQ